MSIQRSGLNDCKRRPKRKRRLAPCWRTVVRGFQRTRIGLDKRWWSWLHVLTKNQQHTSTINQHTSTEYCMVQPNTSSHVTYPCQGVWFHIHVAHRCGWAVNVKLQLGYIISLTITSWMLGFIDARSRTAEFFMILFGVHPSPFTYCN